jgi:hypothetical protein
MFHGFMIIVRERDQKMTTNLIRDNYERKKSEHVSKRNQTLCPGIGENFCTNG